jgi:hypothetical protein
MRGVARAQQQARVKRLDAEQRHRDEIADPATLTANELWSGIYRLQGRRHVDWTARIKALIAEQERRQA